MTDILLVIIIAMLAVRIWQERGDKINWEIVYSTIERAIISTDALMSEQIGVEYDKLCAAAGLPRRKKPTVVREVLKRVLHRVDAEENPLY